MLPPRGGIWCLLVFQVLLLWLSGKESTHQCRGAWWATVRRIAKNRTQPSTHARLTSPSMPREAFCASAWSFIKLSKYRGPCSDLPQTVKRPPLYSCTFGSRGEFTEHWCPGTTRGQLHQKSCGVSSNLFQWFYAPRELRTTMCWGNLALAEGGRWDPGCSCEGWEDLWGFWDNWPSVPWTECERRRWKHATEAWVFFLFFTNWGVIDI